MKHKPQITTDLDDFESLLQETSSVVSNGGDNRGSSPGNTPFKEKTLVIPNSNSTIPHKSFILNPFGWVVVYFILSIIHLRLILILE